MEFRRGNCDNTKQAAAYLPANISARAGGSIPFFSVTMVTLVSALVLVSLNLAYTGHYGHLFLH